MMPLEQLVKIPCDKTSHFQFYEYENGGKRHRIEYEYFSIPGTNLFIVKKLLGETIVSEKCEKGYQNWF